MALKPLRPEQRAAADPGISAFVSASAGTGKTQVLTARVLRLLLAGAAPDRLLALTFTKAAAAEMQTRIFETLGDWVTADDAGVAADLAAIGADTDPATMFRARSLFAGALEARGGIKVQTLHSFASALLAAFPLEAGIAPGATALDERDSRALRHAVLAAEVATGDPLTRRELGVLAVRTGEQSLRELVARLMGDPAFAAEGVSVMASLGEAVAWLVGEGHVDHIDMNFGCPVRKVTRRGGGSALPWKRALLRRIVAAAVRNAGAVPVTIKFRIGIDAAHETFLDAGRIAEDEGCAAVALHARTAAQLYDGEADWSAIARLKEAVRTIPVLGNGDVWEAHDALRMMRTTGCDGVVVGRGCLGRPWLFRDLADVFSTAVRTSCW